MTFPAVGVVGYSGRIGSMFVATLRSQNIPVSLVDRERIGNQRLPFDVLVNCAGLSNPHSSDWDGLIRANIMLPLTLLRQIRDDCHFIYLSSFSVFARGRSHSGMSSLRDSMSPYGVSKLLAEWLVMSSHTPVTVVRVGSVLTPGSRRERVLKKLPAIAVSNDLSRKTAFVSAEELVECLVDESSARPTGNRIVSIPSPSGKALVPYYRETLGIKRVYLCGDRSLDRIFRSCHALLRRSVRSDAYIRQIESLLRGIQWDPGPGP